MKSYGNTFELTRCNYQNLFKFNWIRPRVFKPQFHSLRVWYIRTHCYGIQNRQFSTERYVNVFLHLHEIVEGLYFHCSLSVCMCVCVCVRNSCEQNSSQTDAPIWTRFWLNGCLQHWLGTYWNGDLGSKVKVTVTENVCKNDEKNSPKIHI